jgi:hypothetical protein
MTGSRLLNPLTRFRTLFALYAFDTTCYEILSIPRFLSHLEIKHDMPCSDDLWTLASSTEWAHRTLVADRSTPPVRYITAVRACLSTSPVPNLSTFDSYGLYLVILFLLSGVREVSGWSTMTGRVCFERFEVSGRSIRRDVLVLYGAFGAEPGRADRLRRHCTPHYPHSNPSFSLALPMARTRSSPRRHGGSP